MSSNALTELPPNGERGVDYARAQASSRGGAECTFAAVASDEKVVHRSGQTAETGLLKSLGESRSLHQGASLKETLVSIVRDGPRHSGSL